MRNLIITILFATSIPSQIGVIGWHNLFLVIYYPLDTIIIDSIWTICIWVVVNNLSPLKRHRWVADVVYFYQIGRSPVCETPQRLMNHRPENDEFDSEYRICMVNKNKAHCVLFGSLSDTELVVWCYSLLEFLFSGKHIVFVWIGGLWVPRTLIGWAEEGVMILSVREGWGWMTCLHDTLHVECTKV